MKDHMNKNKQNILIILVATFSLFGLSNVAIASEWIDILTTGLSANTGQTVNGVVITVPTATPAPGTYTTPQDVVLSTPGSSSIRYTFDGVTVPSCTNTAGSVPYLVPIPVSVNKTIKAISCYPGNNFSAVATFGYIINPPQSPSIGGGGGGGGVGGYYVPAIKTSDINSDSKVDKYDFALMMANWGKTGTNSSDLNGDNKVDKYDFALMMANWSK